MAVGELQYLQLDYRNELEVSARHQAVLLPTRHQHHQIAYELLADSFGAASGGGGADKRPQLPSDVYHCDARSVLTLPW